MAAVVIAIAAACLWWAILLAPWRPWSTRERLRVDAEDANDAELHDVTVLIPARDEAALLPATLQALAAQGRASRIIVIDDDSSDNTARVAAAGGAEVIRGTPPPAGWSGKLWALEQGRRRVQSRWIVLLDADIELAPGVLAALRARAGEDGRALVSVMARLRTRSFWERALMPAFVFFFKLLYPFSVANSRSRLVAAAAGGCVLVEADALAKCGGFAAIASEVIDDCALARRLKSHGYRPWIGLSEAVRSRRPSPSFGAIVHMVARTAFTQLRCSLGLLLLCSTLLVLAFWMPVVGLFMARTRLAAVLAWLAMIACYVPMLRFYRRSWWWVLVLPLTGSAYLGMTWWSAWRCWRGARGQWKGRSFGRLRG